MAKLVSEVQFTGTLDSLSAYKMRGVEGIIVRRKGGPSKEKVKFSENFVNTRRNNAEFGGRATAAGLIVSMMNPLKALADYNVTGPLNALVKRVQSLDEVNVWGQRSILLSRNPRILEGFSLNRYTPFDGVVRNPVAYDIDRENLTAVVHIPELIPGINFITPKQHAMFSFVATLGIIPDLHYDELKYIPADFAYQQMRPVVAETSWLPVQAGLSPTTLTLDLKTSPPDDGFSLMLAMGIRYGAMITHTEIFQTRHAGAARVLKMA